MSVCLGHRWEAERLLVFLGNAAFWCASVAYYQAFVVLLLRCCYPVLSHQSALESAVPGCQRCEDGTRVWAESWRDERVYMFMSFTHFRKMPRASTSKYSSTHIAVDRRLSVHHASGRGAGTAVAAQWNQGAKAAESHCFHPSLSSCNNCSGSKFSPLVSIKCVLTSLEWCYHLGWFKHWINPERDGGVGEAWK